MNNQFKSTNRRFTFWLCLLLHLTLGGFLYHHTLENDTAKKDRIRQTEQSIELPAVSIP